MRRGIIPTIAILSIALSAAFAGARPRIGDPAPHYIVRTFDRAVIDSADLKGQVVIINRWATWCAPCKAELPALDAYYRLHARDGLRIFAVATEDSVPASRLQSLQSLLSFPLAASIRGPFPELGGVPTNYLIDRAGIVRYSRAAAFDQATLDAIVGPLLAEPAPSVPRVTAAR